MNRPIQHKTLQLCALLIGSTSIFVSSVHRVLAQAEIIDPGLKSEIEGTTGLGSESPVNTTANIIQAFLTVLGIVAVALIIYAGFRWMFSRGNEEEVKKARGILSAAVIGLTIVLASYGITLYVFSIIEGATGQTAF